MTESRKKVELNPQLRSAVVQTLRKYSFGEVSQIIAPFLVPDTVTEFFFEDVDYAYRFIASKESYANSVQLLRAIEQEMVEQLADKPPQEEDVQDSEKTSE